MRSLYVNSWHGISFQELGSDLSPSRLAGPEFYAKFYQIFFNKYSDYKDLPEHWRREKDGCIQFLSGLASKHPGEWLGVGVGIGYIEQSLIKASSAIELHVHEVSDTATKWLTPIVSPNQVHIGLLPEAAGDRQFDLIYSVQNDYCFPGRDWQNFLASISKLLKPGGSIVYITPRRTESPALDPLRNISTYLKSTLKGNQFWGWRRSLIEHRSDISAAGLAIASEESIIDDKHVAFILKKS